MVPEVDNRGFPAALPDVVIGSDDWHLAATSCPIVCRATLRPTSDRFAHADAVQTSIFVRVLRFLISGGGTLIPQIHRRR